MSVTLVKPSNVQYGDTVVINGENFVVSYVDGPDQNGVYDFYLNHDGETVHKIVTDSIRILN